jgi:D-serine deaminase-like pyridoxal phosphate-dependent protein
LRPHVKTHKAPRIATEQLQRGAVGLTCATTQELDVMAEVCDDLLLAYPPVGAARLERLMRLPARRDSPWPWTAPTACPHSAWRRGSRGASSSVYVEVDVGMRRVGVAPHREAVALAKAVRDTEALRLAGLSSIPDTCANGWARRGRRSPQLADVAATRCSTPSWTRGCRRASSAADPRRSPGGCTKSLA